MDKLLLSGNEAIALGAWEAGVQVGTGYPGTPSTEILEALSRRPGVLTEWSVNEKVALEVGLGAAMSGARTLVTMKHVGLNVAADPLFTASYVGVKAGLVIVCADDPGMHSSQNEQDTRNYAAAARLPLLDPADSREARVMTRDAFALSERYDTPVILRPTTRVSHGKSVVDPQTARDGYHGAPGFTRDPTKWVMIPSHARARRHVLEGRMRDLAAASEGYARTEHRSPVLGFITSGICAGYVREAFPEASLLKLGMVYPLPVAALTAFLAAVRDVYIVEELDPFLETRINALYLRPRPIEGKALFPVMGELDTLTVSRGPAHRGHPSPIGRPASPATDYTVPPRPPALCPGCPHRTVFTTLGRLGVTVAGDIGCYTLGVMPPFSAMDTCIDMGSSLGVAQGMELARMAEVGSASGPRGAPGVAVIGDSTFAHSGLTGLLNAAYNGRRTLNIVLDNGTTAMTGLQPNPLSGERIDGTPSPVLDYRKLASAVGIADANVRIVDAYKPAEIEEAITTLLDRGELALLVVKGLCVLLKKRRKAEAAT